MVFKRRRLISGANETLRTQGVTNETITHSLRSRDASSSHGRMRCDPWIFHGRCFFRGKNQCGEFNDSTGCSCSSFADVDHSAASRGDSFASLALQLRRRLTGRLRKFDLQPLRNSHVLFDRWRLQSRWSISIAIESVCEPTALGRLF